MRTRFLHVAWVLSNNPQYGQEAVATEVYADYYESLAEKSTQEGENLRAVIMLKKACHLYSKVNRDKLLESRNKLVGRHNTYKQNTD